MKNLIIDMNQLSAEVIRLSSKYNFLGGRSFTSVLTSEITDPKCDPLGPYNNLILACGLLTGSSAINTGRLSIGAKSPLTKGIKESNVGGTASLALARLGLNSLIIKGIPQKKGPYILHIDENAKPTIEKAEHLKGMRTYALCQELFERFGEKNSIVCIGPCGENEMSIASIQVTDVDNRPCRAAGRGGLGAVMGAKGLKAIIISRKGKKPPEIKNPEAFNKASKELAKAVKAAPFPGKVLPKFGTSALVAGVNSIGAFPSFNATQGVFSGWEKISGEALYETITQRKGNTTHMGCTGCIIKCSNEYLDATGEFITSSLEYETIWSTGGMCGIDDLDTIAKLDRLCDEIGVDTINCGVAVAVAMDAGHAQFGDSKKAIEMVEDIGNAKGFGKILGMGPVNVGKALGHHRVPACKNQSIAAYDPRAIQGMAATYATCPMGADHTAGNFIGDALSGAVDPLSPKGVEEMSRNKQIGVMGVDSLGLCLFAMAGASSDLIARLYNAKLGLEKTPEELTKLWTNALEQEKHFNFSAGLTKEDDRLPAFFYQEPLPPHNKTVAVTASQLDSVWNNKE